MIHYVAIVDDDPSVCRSFARLLRAAGFRSVEYASAEAFLDDTKRPRFSCLVLDIELPGISGTELSRRLSCVNDHTPSVFITASDDPVCKAEAAALGCAGYFLKHEPGGLIIQVIRDAINGPSSGL